MDFCDFNVATRITNELSFQPKDPHSTRENRFLSIRFLCMLDKNFRDRSVFNMSDKEQDIHTPDGVHDSIYFSPGSVFFAANSSPNASLTPTSDLGNITQQEVEKTLYFTPNFERFLQWRQMDRSLNNSSFTPILKMCDENTTETCSSCDESLIEKTGTLN